MLPFSLVKAESSRPAQSACCSAALTWPVGYGEDGHGRLWELTYTLDDLAEHDVSFPTVQSRAPCRPSASLLRWEIGSFHLGRVDLLGLASAQCAGRPLNLSDEPTGFGHCVILIIGLQVTGKYSARCARISLADYP